MITIFEPKDIEYPEKLNKPVRYDANFLKDMASTTGSINITRNHSKEVIGVLENFVFEDGVLKANEPQNLNIKGMGFSPVFECDLVDKGDYYQPVNGYFKEIGFTENPRSSILYNSIEENDKMSESLDIVIKEKEELQKKLGVLENENNSYKSIIKRKDEEIASIKESYSDIDMKLAELEALKNKAEEYDKYQENLRDSLLDEVCNGDDKLKEKYASFNLEQLNVIKDTRIQNRPAEGIPPQGVSNLDVDGNQQVEEKGYTDEDFKADLKSLGW